MIRLRTLGLALVAVFAISAVTVASASAATNPEFKPTKGGFPVAFSSPLSKTTTTLETKSNGTVSCSELESSGEVKAAREVKKVVITFKKCKSTGFLKEGPCTTPGKAEGEIVPSDLAGKPVYINGKHGAKEERGLDLFPESGTLFAKFKCEVSGFFAGSTEIKVENTKSAKDDIIGVISGTEVGTKLEKVKIKFSKKAAGEQTPNSFEEEVGGTFVTTESFLESTGENSTGLGKNFAAEPSNEQGEETITYAGKETVELS